MYRKPISYQNFNGEQVTKNFYFNITKAELAIAELESDGTWSETIAKIAASDKGSVVMPEFKKILKWCYGEKSEDGEEFDKSDAVWNKFVNSEPWSQLIWELITVDGYSADFINAVLPPDIAAAAKEARAQNGFRPGASTQRPTPPVIGVVAPPQVPVYDVNTAQTPQEVSITDAERAELEELRSAKLNRDVTFNQNIQMPEQAQTRREARQEEQGIQHESTPRTDLQQ